MKVRVVYDTNVLLGSILTSSELITNRQVVRLWRDGRVVLLYSLDTLLEYSEKLIELGSDPSTALEMLAAVAEWGELVAIENFHLRHHPTDPDDIAFVLCAANGEATHLLTYDHHLSDLAWAYDFTICAPAEFLAWFATNNPEG